MRHGVHQPYQRATLADDAGAPAAGERFRALMGSFPSGVAVVTTTADGGEPRGFTCSSLCSVSLDPPTLLVCVDNRSGTLRAVQDRGAFAVNVLHARGIEAAEVFASGAPDRFERVPWEPSALLSLPELPHHAHAVAECAVTAAHDAGDHTVVIGRVLAARVRPGARPLVYGTRRFTSWPWPVPSPAPDAAPR
jgi:flavin reductase (NADH)